MSARWIRGPTESFGSICEGQTARSTRLEAATWRCESQKISSISTRGTTTGPRTRRFGSPLASDNYFSRPRCLTDEGTRLVMTSEFTSEAHRQQALAQGIAEGWEMFFPNLDDLLATLD